LSVIEILAPHVKVLLFKVKVSC